MDRVAPKGKSDWEDDLTRYVVDMAVSDTVVPYYGSHPTALDTRQSKADMAVSYYYDCVWSGSPTRSSQLQNLTRQRPS